MTRKSSAARITVADVEPLVDKYRGNIAAIARALNVSRGTIHNRINESPTLAQAIEDARETMLDNVESSLYSQALDGNIPAMIFWLKCQGKARGWVERQEVTGADGGELTFRVVYGDDGADG